jgi:hypothetical protein
MIYLEIVFTLKPATNIKRKMLKSRENRLTYSKSAINNNQIIIDKYQWRYEIHNRLDFIRGGGLTLILLSEHEKPNE